MFYFIPLHKLFTGECFSFFSGFCQRPSMAKYVLCVLERSMYSSSVGWTCNVYLLGSHVLKWDPKARVHQCCVCCESAAVGSYPNTCGIAAQVQYPSLLSEDKIRLHQACVLRSAPRLQKQLPTLLQGFLHHTRSWSWNRAVTTSGHTAVTCGKEL